MGSKGAPYEFKDFPHSSHRLLLSWAGPGPCRTLDVGAASGFLGAALNRAGHTVVGVEKDPSAAEQARVHYQSFYVTDLTALGTLPEAPFDLIVVGDVLEHLPQPDEVLKKLVSLLAAPGRLLVSVPNVAFVQVRLELLIGRFEYQRRGVLDATHLRFFTKKTFHRFLASGGLEVLRWRGLPPPLPLVFPATARWPGRVFLETAALAARLWPQLFAYQFVAEAWKGA